MPEILAAKSETVGTGNIFRAGTNTMANYYPAGPETKTSVVFVMPVGCQPLEFPALALKSVLKPQSLPALYQTKPPNAGIMLTSVT